jgi:WD40 repeat protein/CubicO group peptidase (beta-lactamase class C family)
MKKRKYLIVILVVLMTNITGIFLSRGINNSITKENSITSMTDYTTNFANLTGHGRPIWDLAFSPDDSMVASSSGDGSVRIWNVTNGQTIHLLQGHYFDVYSTDFNLDGSILASADWNDRKINFWNVSTGNLINSWHYAFRGFRIEFSPIEKDLLAYPYQNTTILRNVTDGTLIYNLTGHTDIVWTVAFSPDGSLLATCSGDQSIKIWDVATGLEIHTLTGPEDHVYTVSFSANNSLLASGGPDETIRIWDINTGALLQTHDVGYHVLTVDFSPLDPDILVSGGGVPPDPIQPTPVQLWNLTNGDVQDLTGHMNTVIGTAFSHDGTMIASCSVDRTIKLWGDYPSYSLPSVTIDWPTSTPEEQGLSSADLEQIPNDVDYLDSLLVIRHGHLIFEEYYNDSSYVYTPESRHIQYSVTKSFTSALIGIAIEKGFIQNVDQKVLDFFPDMTFANTDSRKEAMTLEHLLTMTTGLEWDDSEHIEMTRGNDTLQYVLDKPMVSEPGTVYNYNTGGSHVLSAILQQATDYANTLDFAIEYLFEPLGIEEPDIIWQTDVHGRCHGGNQMYLTPRGMARFGQLYLNNGSWNNEQIVPADWVTVSTSTHVAPEDALLAGGAGYGYQWWTYEDAVKSVAGYTASGYDGQIIYVMPREDIVVVTTSHRWRDPNIVPRFVASAIIPENVTTSSISSMATSNTTSTSETTTTTGGASSTPLFLVISSLIVGVVLFRKKKAC